MTPLVFNKGVADSGVWGNKFFGRIMMQESRIGDGCAHKVWRAKVIYGLEPVFESGNTCIVKVRNPIAYGGKGESCLIDKNLDFVRQVCKKRSGENSNNHDGIINNMMVKLSRMKGLIL